MGEEYTEYMLTTIDNPYDPFEDFVNWYKYDMSMGYNLSSKVARLAELSDDQTQKERNEAIEKAMDFLIKNDMFDIIKKVKKERTDLIVSV